MANITNPTPQVNFNPGIPTPATPGQPNIQPLVPQRAPNSPDDIDRGEAPSGQEEGSHEGSEGGSILSKKLKSFVGFVRGKATSKKDGKEKKEVNQGASSLFGSDEEEFLLVGSAIEGKDEWARKAGWQEYYQHLRDQSEVKHKIGKHADQYFEDEQKKAKK